MYESYLEPIIETYTTGSYYPEVFKARQEYFEKAGIVFESDREFEQRMCIFMDWYIFDRDLPGVDLPPIKYFYRKHKDQLSEDDLGIYRDFSATIHSVFRLKRLTWDRQSFIVVDLFSQKKYKVHAPEIQAGFQKGDLFEARLIPFKGRFEFSKGFCFHAADVEGFILNEVKKVRFQEKTRQTKLILQLAAMKLKQLRFPHIDVGYIYRFDSRF